MPTHKIAHLGVGYCPEERGIFSSLSCEENLMLPPPLKTGEPGMSIDEIYEMFPNLYERRNSQGTRLSGGEQQMLAVARILRTGARLLLLDEISEGLAPVIVQALARMITTLRRRLHRGDGGAELPLCRAAGRPLLCDGARPCRLALRSQRTGRRCPCSTSCWASEPASNSHSFTTKTQPVEIKMKAKLSVLSCMLAVAGLSSPWPRPRKR
jgi:hypothetical protein